MAHWKSVERALNSRLLFHWIDAGRMYMPKKKRSANRYRSRNPRQGAYETAWPTPQSGARSKCCFRMQEQDAQVGGFAGSSMDARASFQLSLLPLPAAAAVGYLRSSISAKGKIKDPQSVILAPGNPRRNHDRHHISNANGHEIRVILCTRPLQLLVGRLFPIETAPRPCRVIDKVRQRRSWRVLASWPPDRAGPRREIASKVLGHNGATSDATRECRGRV